MIHLTVITVIIGVMGVNYAAQRSARFAAYLSAFIFLIYTVCWCAFVFRGPLFGGSL